jgi:hypothetical protein
VEQGVVGSGGRRHGLSSELTYALYQIVRSLPRFGFPVPGEIPVSGIYLFFERGEVISLHGEQIDRITRVGTHIRDGRLATRLKQHYGPVRKPGGNKNASAFRRHVGGALLTRVNPQNPNISGWIKQGGPRDMATEVLVSEWLRQQTTFCCIPVANAADRLELERGLISLLSQSPESRPSSSWLGLYAQSTVIRQGGLWNVTGMGKSPLTHIQLETILQLTSV